MSKTTSKMMRRQIFFNEIIYSSKWEQNGTPENNNGNPPETILNTAALGARKAS